DYFVQLAEEGEPHLRGPEQLEWADRLDADHDNLRAALAWSQGEGRVERGLRLVAALAWYWDLRAYFREAREQVDALLALPEATPRTMLRARALFAAVGLTKWLGDPTRIRQ